MKLKYILQHCNTFYLRKKKIIFKLYETNPMVLKRYCSISKFIYFIILLVVDIFNINKNRGILLRKYIKYSRSDLNY